MPTHVPHASVTLMVCVAVVERFRMAEHVLSISDASGLLTDGEHAAAVASPVSDCWSSWVFAPPCGPFWKSSTILTVCVAVAERFRVAGYPAHCCRANAAFSSNSSTLSGTVRKYVAPATGPNLLRRTEVHRRLHRDRFLPL